jgi:hypothetical protein
MHVRFTQTNIRAAHNLHKQPITQQQSTKEKTSAQPHKRSHQNSERSRPVNTGKRCHIHQADEVSCSCLAQSLAAPF